MILTTILQDKNYEKYDEIQHAWSPQGKDWESKEQKASHTRGGQRKSEELSTHQDAQRGTGEEDEP